MKKSFVLGMVAGIVATTALISSMSSHSIKRVKRAVINKIEDAIM